MDAVAAPVAASLEKSETLLHCFAGKIVDFLENLRRHTIKSLRIEKKRNFNFRQPRPKALGSATAKSLLIVILEQRASGSVV